MELYFSPADEALGEVIAEVQTAAESITFAIFFLTSDELRDALIERAHSGVEVRGVWDALGAANPYSDDETLCAAGIPIKVETFAGKMHNKFMVIDANGPNPRIITGSMNWTSSGDEDNDENSLIIHDLGITQAFGLEFDSFYEALPPETGCTMDVPPLGYHVFLPAIMSNISTTTPTANVQLVSITYNPSGDDADGEHVIIENRGGAAQPMLNWTLSDVAGATYTFPDFILASGTQVAVWLKSGVNTDTNLYWGYNSPVWNNNGDTATLADSTGQEVDVCTYDGGSETVTCD